MPYQVIDESIREWQLVRGKVGDSLNHGEFKDGDITSLPETNAKSLISRGAARSLLSTDCKNDGVGVVIP